MKMNLQFAAIILALQVLLPAQSFTGTRGILHFENAFESTLEHFADLPSIDRISSDKAGCLSCGKDSLAVEPAIIEKTPQARLGSPAIHQKKAQRINNVFAVALQTDSRFLFARRQVTIGRDFPLCLGIPELIKPVHRKQHKGYADSYPQCDSSSAEWGGDGCYDHTDDVTKACKQSNASYNLIDLPLHGRSPVLGPIRSRAYVLSATFYPELAQKQSGGSDTAVTADVCSSPVNFEVANDPVDAFGYHVKKHNRSYNYQADGLKEFVHEFAQGNLAPVFSRSSWWSDRFSRVRCVGGFLLPDANGLRCNHIIAVVNLHRSPLTAVLDTPVQRIIDCHVIANKSLLDRGVYSESFQDSGCRNLSDGSLVVDPQHVAFAPVFQVALKGGAENVRLQAVKDGHGLGAGLLNRATKRSRDIGDSHRRRGVDDDLGFEFLCLSRNVISGDSCTRIEDESVIFDRSPSHHRSGWSGGTLCVLRPLVRRSIPWIQAGVIPEIVSQSDTHYHAKPKWERVLALSFSFRGVQSATILTCAREYVKQEVAA